jgi:uncharacterized DUF497 family protein
MWDESKRKLNLAKHGIDFRDAQSIFEGPLVTAEDSREDYGETRYVALGLLEGIVVSIAYTERGESVRIISIRKALKHEARFFLSQIGK